MVYKFKKITISSILKKSLIIFFFLLVSVFTLKAQNVNGFWKGTLTMTGGCFPVNNIEIQISLTGDSVNGNSYHYLDINNYVKKNFRGSYDAAVKKVTIQEGLVTTFNIPPTCTVCIKNYELTYRKEGDKEYLIGDWNGKVMNTSLSCLPGHITLSRIKESAFKEIPEIMVDTGDIRLDFYDNGEIDGDSITVLVNHKVVISHQKLGAKPITSHVRVDLQNTFQEIEMVAENLGSIPPNTALLIITAGEKRYSLFLTSTETKAAKVRFVYDKKL